MQLTRFAHSLRHRAHPLLPLSCTPCRTLSTTASTSSSTSSSSSSASRFRLVSGIQPSGVMHLGNYLGAVNSWIKLQNGTFTPTKNHAATSPVQRGQPVELFLFLADWHALTTAPDPTALDSSRVLMGAQLLACGLDPKRSTLFIQSHVREHLELSWIFSCLTPHMLLTRMTQFKTKAKDLADPRAGPGGKEGKSASLGLFSYPVLQAADILLYQAVGVPVGEDQFQHVELCRDIASLYNKQYASPTHAKTAASSNLPLPFAFPLPQHLATPISRVMSLRDGTKKMSKSDASDASRINLTDDSTLIAKKIKAAKTDSIDQITFDRDARPEVANLLTMLSELSGRTIEEIIADPHLSTKQKLKSNLTDQLVQLIDPIRSEFERIQKDETYVRGVLKDGAAKARTAAEATMRAVKAAVKIGEF